MIDDQAYTLKIIKKVILSYLDENIPNNETGLNILVDQCDDLVYKIASKIYTESGYKVDFLIIRDVIYSRIEPLQEHIARIKKEEVRKLEAKRLGEENSILGLEEKRKLYEKDKDKIISDLFLEVKYIISEQLEVELNEITLESNLYHDLGVEVNELDYIELIMDIEEHFDIEIPDEIGEKLEPYIMEKRTKKTTNLSTWCDSSKIFGEYYLDCTVYQLLEAISPIIEQQNKMS